MPRAKVDSKPKGRMSAYAFFVQARREEHKRERPDENVIFSEFSRSCADKWKLMDDKDKQRFHDLADKDKTRYNMEMSDYHGPLTGRGRKRRQKKDPNAPKRALSAFFWFCNDERPKARSLYPNMGIGEMAKELAQRWGSLSQEQKIQYDEMAKKDKDRYVEEMKVFKSSPLAFKQDPTPTHTLPPSHQNNPMMNFVANTNFASNSGFQPAVNYNQNFGATQQQMNYAGYGNYGNAAAAAAAAYATNLGYASNAVAYGQQQQQQEHSEEDDEEDDEDDVE